MPQILKSAKDGQIAVKEFYTAGDLAFLTELYPHLLIDGSTHSN